MSNNDDLIAELNAEIVRLSQLVDHWRAQSDKLASSRQTHSATTHRQSKRIDFLEDWILEYWGY